MSAKDRRSHAQKRKAKLAKRAQRRSTEPQPYSGTKYQTERWVPHVYRTELPIYEAIVLSRRGLTDAQVRAALVNLIEHLRAGQPPLLPEDAPEVLFAPGNEVPYLVWNIRRHWCSLFEEQSAVPVADLIGILRTLLHSIEAHAWNTGADRGYVAFLYDFMQQRW
jgi:hypothetical protein